MTLQMFAYSYIPLSTLINRIICSILEKGYVFLSKM